MRKTNVLYFSLNSRRQNAISIQLQTILNNATQKYYDINGAIRSNNRLLLDISALPPIDAHSVFDLERFLSSCKCISSLFIIIDYVSLCGRSTDDWDKNAEIIQNIILRFPEVNFVFDEHSKSKENLSFSFLDFIIPQNKFYYKTPEAKGKVIELKETAKKMVMFMHQFDLAEKENALIKLCYFQDNLFDASGLRFLLKIKKYENLHAGTHNFKRVQYSRFEHLALCVEEERSQSLFNCYACYANGYRSLPVITAQGLELANKSLKPNIVLRDYDLQFPDEPEGDTDAIKYIRGWSHVDDRWEKCTKDSKYWKDLDYSIVNDDNDNNDKTPQVFYVTKGEFKMDLSLKGHNQQRIELKSKKLFDELSIPGIQKPIAGIFAPFHKIDSIRKTCENSLDKDNINTKRKKGGHGVPLDIYYDVKSMVERAEQYYEEKRFIHSAILAQEAMEIMNGFHEALMMSAYRRKAMAENAIAANILGGDERQLRDDTRYRVYHIIEPDIHRLIRSESMSHKEEREKSKNILNQIYVDCRKLCQAKEHFLAEDCFISAMGHLNEKFSFF